MSRSEYLPSWVVSSFVVSDCADKPKAQRIVVLVRGRGLGRGRAEATVLDPVVGSFNLCSAVVRLFSDKLLELAFLSVVLRLTTTSSPRRPHTKSRR